MKSEIIKELGQADILLPSLVADGLAANDRIKVRMSVLQAASQHAHALAAPGRAKLIADIEADATAMIRAVKGGCPSEGAEKRLAAIPMACWSPERRSISPASRG
jgi:hypothetical protein